MPIHPSTPPCLARLAACCLANAREAAGASCASRGCWCHPLVPPHARTCPAPASRAQLADKLCAVNCRCAGVDSGHWRRRHRAGCAAPRLHLGGKDPVTTRRRLRGSMRRARLPLDGAPRRDAGPSAYTLPIHVLALLRRPADLWVQDHADTGREDVPPVTLARCGGRARARRAATSLPAAATTEPLRPQPLARGRRGRSGAQCGVPRAPCPHPSLGIPTPCPHPPAGFVVEISSAMIVFLGSRFSLPISTTHCLVGAVSGIGEASRARMRRVSRGGGPCSARGSAGRRAACDTMAWPPGRVAPPLHSHARPGPDPPPPPRPPPASCLALQACWRVGAASTGCSCCALCWAGWPPWWWLASPQVTPGQARSRGRPAAPRA